MNLLTERRAGTSRMARLPAGLARIDPARRLVLEGVCEAHRPAFRWVYTGQLFDGYINGYCIPTSSAGAEGCCKRWGPWMTADRNRPAFRTSPVRIRPPPCGGRERPLFEAKVLCDVGQSRNRAVKLALRR